MVEKACQTETPPKPEVSTSGPRPEDIPPTLVVERAKAEEEGQVRELLSLSLPILTKGAELLGLEIRKVVDRKRVDNGRRPSTSLRSLGRINSMVSKIFHCLDFYLLRDISLICVFLLFRR